MSAQNKQNIFTVKRIKNLEQFFVPFSPFTRMPYVECDKDTFDDQVHLFDSEETVKAFVKEQIEELQTPMQTVRVEKAQIPGFWMSLYTQGVNAVMIHEGESGPVRVELEEIHKKPDIEKLNAGKLPLVNPQLQLTAVYFMQELRKRNPADADELTRKRLQEMEEEMMVNLERSRYIIAVETTGDEGETDPKKLAQNVRIPCLKGKNGEVYQPLFTDMGEFRKFYNGKKEKMRLGAVPFAKLNEFLNQEAVGFLLNPSTLQLVLAREKLEQMTNA